MPAVSGTVKDSSGAFIAKTVRVYRLDTGAFVGETISNAVTGTWSVTTTDYSEHFAVVHDVTPVSALDPYWGKVVLGLHMDGSNGSTTILDERGHTVTANGNAALSTAQKKFGTASCAFDGSGDYLSIPAASEFNSGTGDFTLDFQMYYTGTTNPTPTLVTNNNGGWSSGAIALRVDDVGQTDKISLVAYDYNSSGFALLSSSSTVTYNTFHHVELGRSGNTWYLFINGTLVSTATAAISCNFGKNNLLIGGGNWDGANSYFKGNIDDLRLTVGSCRHTSGFTAPAAAFPSPSSAASENALILDRLIPV